MTGEGLGMGEGLGAGCGGNADGLQEASAISIMLIR